MFANQYVVSILQEGTSEKRGTLRMTYAHNEIDKNGNKSCWKWWSSPPFFNNRLLYTPYQYLYSYSISIEYFEKLPSIFLVFDNDGV